MKNTKDASSQTSCHDVIEHDEDSGRRMAPPAQPMPKRQKIVYSQTEFRLRGFEGAWPTQTDVKCWYCSHCFDTTPLGIPLERNAGGVYQLSGVYCSFGCMKADNMQRCSSHKRTLSSQLIGEMMRDVYGIVNDVPLAPPRQLLKEFGGTMTIEEFRRDSLQTTKQLVEPPLLPVKTLIEEIPAVTKTSAYKQTKSFADTSAPLLPSVQKAALKLKRKQPLETKSSLDKFMSIEHGNERAPPPLETLSEATTTIKS